MSLDRQGAYDQRLLPASIEDRLVGFFGRAGGIALLALIAALWTSIITWSVADPSLTHATGGRAGNALGMPGAIVSDLMLQTLGVGAVLAILAPMLWALELVASERVRDFRARVTFYPLAVLILSGGLSALPVAAAWPLNHGYGGILGDLIFGLASSTFGILNPERGALAGGIVLLLGGLASLLTCIGVELKDLAAALARGRHTATGAAHAMPRRAWLAWPLRRGAARAGAMTPPLDMHFPAAPFAPAQLQGGAYPPDPAATWQRDWRPAPVRHALQGGAPLTSPMHVLPSPHAAMIDPGFRGEPELPMGEAWPIDAAPSGATGITGLAPPGCEPSFDDHTDVASRAIAERFAPAGAARVLPSRQSTAPTPQPLPAGPAQGPGKTLLSGMSFRRSEPSYKRPSLNLLKRAAPQRPGADHAPAMLRGTARLLEDVLLDFGVKGEIKDIRPGPVVTLFELEPARGTKSSRIIALADDIARSMSATAVRVAIVPGRNVIGIELPNARRETVLLRELLEAEAFRSSDATLPITLGKSIGGEPVVADLARMPHLLVAGTTGSGKSVGVNAMILSLLFRHAPEDCRFLMIDPKMLELSVYNGIPHLLTPVVTDPHKAVAALNWAVREMEERYKRMSQLSVRNIDVFNNRVRNARKRGERMLRTVQTGFDRTSGQPVFEQEQLALEPLPYIVIVVDEFADLMVVAGKEIEAAVQRLAQMARAAGIHLIMATQRPSVDIVTGTIKANFPTRISFKVASKIDSRTILNDQGAEQLLGQGDMLYAGSSGGQPTRVHGAFVSDEEVEQIATFLRAQGTPRYVDGVTDAPAAEEAGTRGGEPGSDDDLYDRAVAVVLRDGKASTSYIQRRLAIGYNRAADLIERMEQEGLIGPANSVGRREILAGRELSGSSAA